MTPTELYRLFEAKYPHRVVGAICEVETTCRRQGFCEHRQSVQVIDFDEVKNDFYQGVRSPASVDAVCASGSGRYFCFVELKGWKNYLRFENKQKEGIEATAASYHLDRKLEASEQLCISISSDGSLFASMSVVFVLVTDIDVAENGMEAFAGSLFALAETSSDRYLRCRTAAMQVLETEIKVEHDYVCCKDFDRHIADL